MAEEELSIGIGDPNEMKHFVETYPVFMEKFASLEAVRNKVFERQGEGNLFDIVIFAFGKVCAEDFQQVFVLCGNGFGIGAMQMLRGMYERHVTAAYLLTHQDELDRFIAYDKVHRNKALVHFARPYTAEELDKMIPREAQDKIKEEYESVRKDFREPLCKKCGSTQAMRSWTTLSTLDLAIKGERGLDGHYYHHYYEPTLFTHSTAAALNSRIQPDKNGRPVFDAEGQRKKVGSALQSAHLLLLFVIDLQNEYFKLGLDAELKKLSKDYRDCWASNEPNPPGENAEPASAEH